MARGQLPNSPSARFVLGWAIAWLAAGAVVPACLSLAEADGETATDAGAGTGGTGVGDSSWGTGATAGVAGAAGGASGGGGSGGFTPTTCNSCNSPGGCECVPSVAQGWSYTRIVDGNKKNCSNPASTPIIVGSGAVDTGCGVCQCGSATGGSCGIRRRRYSYAGCAGSYTWSSVYTEIGKCVSTTSPGAAVMLDALGVGGSCGPGTAPPKAPTFAQTKTLCTEESAGACGQGGACIPAAATGVENKACVVFDSQGVDVACPADYPQKLSYSTGFDDTRQCSCSCKANVSCTGGAAVFDCAATSGSDLNQCVDGTQAGEFKVMAVPTVTGASCSADSVPAPSGGKVSASGLRVVCCR